MKSTRRDSTRLRYDVFLKVLQPRGFKCELQQYFLQSLGRTSPKKLVKQPCIVDPDNVFEHKADEKYGQASQHQHGEGGKSVGFV